MLASLSALTATCLPSEIVVGVDRAGPGTSAEGDAGASCASDADCPGDARCAYAIADGCGAIGACYGGASGTICGSTVLACGCDGATVSVPYGGPSCGLAPQPIFGMGACDSGAASTVNAGEAGTIGGD